ncbi:MAG: endonuclease/exonuclease/phosphatase family protein [Cyclobacteriaceae bacterium]
MILSISCVLFLLPADIFYLDLLQSFSFHAILGYAFLFVFFYLFRWKYPAVTALTACLLLSIYLLPHIRNINSQSYKWQGQKVKVAHFNLLANNSSHVASVRLALSTDADLLSFQEVDMIWINQLVDGLSEEYPYFAFTNGMYHGVAVFSRYPLEEIKTYRWTGEPTLTGDVLIDRQRIHFVATHTLSPRTAERYLNRNEHLEKLASYIREQNGPVMAIGDFNAVPWSQKMMKVKKVADLTDSRKGVVPTYPSKLREGGIPIDYILHSDEIACLQFEAIDPAGSDHRGIFGEYIVRGTWENQPLSKTEGPALSEASI